MRIYLIACLIAISFLFSGCGGDDSSGPEGNNGLLRLTLTDAPIDLQQVSVTINEIEVHQTGGGWQNFSSENLTVDLLTLKGREALLASGNLADGKYTGFRLHIEEGFIVDTDGNRCDLTVPSDKIEIPVVIDINQGETTTVLSDFDAEKSIHVIQTGNDEKCILRPVIHVVDVSQNQ